MRRNLCIMDTLGPIITVLIIKVSGHNDKTPFGTKHVDYAGVLIFKCPD